MAHKDWKEMFDCIWRERGNTFIQFLLDAGLDVNALNKHGKTLLSYAAEWGNLEITEFLLRKGAEGNVANIDGSIPLHNAAQYGHKNIVKFFLEKGISANCRDNNQCTPLHYVAFCDNSSVGRECFQEIVHLLVDSNADLDAVNRLCHTPLVSAAYYSRKYIVELLIKLGANVNLCDEAQWTVLHHSSRKGWSDIVRSLVEGGLDIDLNAITSGGHTPLSLAAVWSHKNVVELLINSGANVNYNSRYQWTVLHSACREGWSDLVKYLVNAGCDLNAKNERGRTPLILAAEYSHCGIVEYLIDSGANLGVCGKDERTVLHLACKNGCLHVIKSLIKRGCDPNVRDKRNDTPLHIAVWARNTEIVGYLLAAGADWHLQNIYGITAFNKCFQRRVFYLEGMVLFIENGAYFKPYDYNVLIKYLEFKKGILQDVKLCAQTVMNQFNNAELLKLYEIPEVAKRLPSIEKMKISSKGNVAQGIAKSVNYEIQTKGYCDLLKVRPIFLSCLCLESLVEYYKN